MPLADILGHDRAVAIFRRARATGRIPHAYIFEGPSGCGRRTTALELVKALFCSKAGDDACGVCIACRKVAGGNHPDLHLIGLLEDKREISIDQIRELQRELHLRPYEAPRKVCIIEPAERLNEKSANAFLKTLEEPPGNAVIILLTENRESLLATIRSRCQLIRFSPLSPENARTLLVRGGMDAARAETIALLCEGSLEQGLALDDELMNTRRNDLLNRMEQFNSNQIATIFSTTEEFAGNRDETLQALDMLLSLVRDMVYSCAGHSEIANSYQRERITALAAGHTLESALEMLADILEIRRTVQRNANIKLALDCLFMRLAGVQA